MKTVTIAKPKDKVEGFPHQLLRWQKNRVQLNHFIEPFIKYNKLHKVVVVKCDSMFALFTTGEGMVKSYYYGMVSDIRLKNQKEKYL